MFASGADSNRPRRDRRSVLHGVLSSYHLDTYALALRFERPISQESLSNPANLGQFAGLPLESFGVFRYSLASLILRRRVPSVWPALSFCFR